MGKNSYRRRLTLGLGLLLFVVIGLWWWQQRAASVTAVPPSLLPLLSETTSEAFARATEPGAIEFPRDLGPHNEYQTEWWYYTGNLRGEDGRQEGGRQEDGREFGYQLTFFRRALGPELGDNSSESPISNLQSPQSNWRTNQIYLAHFTISDVANGDFYQQERFSRGAAGLAGAQAEPYRVWLEDWTAEEIAPGVVRLTAVTNEVALTLDLTQSLPPILHGDAGLSQKGPEPGNASYYYSFVQQPTEGTLRIGKESFTVSGFSWKDHEYSTSALTRDTVGWDWFSVQLEDGTAVMLVQIRELEGTASPYSSGTFVAADGTTAPLTANEFAIEVTDSWQSPTTGGEYPAGWLIHIPSLELELTAVPLLPNQELIGSTIYWEGAVAYEGTLAGEPVTGRGYVELTGYVNSEQ
jgi:predicted secreted hydrolase